MFGTQAEVEQEANPPCISSLDAFRIANAIARKEQEAIEHREHELAFMRAVADNDSKALYSRFRKISRDIANDDGVTALMLASIHGHEQVSWLLLSNNNDPLILDKCGRTALFWAIDGSHYTMARRLITCMHARGSINSIKSQHIFDIELRHAVELQNTAIVKELLQAGANVEWGDENGCSTLWIASQSGNPDLVRLLLGGSNPLDLCSANAAGVTPLAVAVMGTHRAVVELLIRHGFRVDIALLTLDAQQTMYLDMCVDATKTVVALDERFRQLIDSFKKEETGAAKDMLLSLLADDAFVIKVYPNSRVDLCRRI